MSSIGDPRNESVVGRLEVLDRAREDLLESAGLILEHSRVVDAATGNNPVFDNNGRYLEAQTEPGVFPIAVNAIRLVPKGIRPVFLETDDLRIFLPMLPDFYDNNDSGLEVPKLMFANLIQLNYEDDSVRKVSQMAIAREKIWRQEIGTDASADLIAYIERINPDAVLSQFRFDQFISPSVEETIDLSLLDNVHKRVAKDIETVKGIREMLENYRAVPVKNTSGPDELSDDAA